MESSLKSSVKQKKPWLNNVYKKIYNEKLIFNPISLHFCKKKKFIMQTIEGILDTCHCLHKKKKKKKLLPF